MQSIHIVLALDEKYWHKAKEYNVFDSILHNTKDNKCIFVKCLCLGFDIPDSDIHFKSNRWEWARCEISELKSYREGWPRKQKNRSYFVCAEGGEFLDFFNFNPADIIIHIDADTTMQRPLSEEELKSIHRLKDGQVGGSYHANPTIPLYQEIYSLRPCEPERNIRKHFSRHWEEPVFCSGLIVATAKTYRDVIYERYLPRIDKMVMLFNHHAGGQWLMNYVVYEWAEFVDLGRSFGHADWFIGSEGEQEDNRLMYKGKIVLFNHHKFNQKWSFE